MSSIRTIPVNDDRYVWGVGSSVLGRADVIIPVDQLGDMSDERIGKLVRMLHPQAVDLFAREMIDGLGVNEPQNCPDSWLREISDLLGNSPQSSPLIRELGDIIEKETQRRNMPVTKKRRPRQVAGFVYLAYAETGHHKIGISKHPGKRIKVFNTKMPVAVQLVHVFPSDDMRKSEQDLHKQYAHKRHDGEWFNLDGWDIEYVMKISHYESGKFHHNGDANGKS